MPPNPKPRPKTPHATQKQTPPSPEFDLDAVPPPPPGGLPIDQLVVEPAMFTGGFQGVVSDKKEGKADKAEGKDKK
jgi:hypothetical protein